MTPYFRDSHISGRTYRSVRQPAEKSARCSIQLWPRLKVALGSGCFSSFLNESLIVSPILWRPQSNFALGYYLMRGKVRRLLDAVALCDSIRLVEFSAYLKIQLFLTAFIRSAGVAGCQFADRLVQFWIHLPGWRITTMLDWLNFEHICIPLLGAQLCNGSRCNAVVIHDGTCGKNFPGLLNSVETSRIHGRNESFTPSKPADLVTRRNA